MCGDQRVGYFLIKRIRKIDFYSYRSHFYLAAKHSGWKLFTWCNRNVTRTTINVSTAEKRIGTPLISETSYLVNGYLPFAFDASCFLAGNYVRKTGQGKKITYL
jgi:hypothetical protein